jgi:hypothetical protein
MMNQGAILGRSFQNRTLPPGETPARGNVPLSA